MVVRRGSLVVYAVVVLLALATGASALLSPASTKVEVGKLKAAARKLGRYKNTLSLLDRRGPVSFVDVLLQVLTVEQITVLLPTDAAWSKLPPGIRNKLSRGSTKAVIDAFKSLTLKANAPASRLASWKSGSTVLTLRGSLLQKRSSGSKLVLGLPGSKQTKAYGIIGDRNVLASSRMTAHGIDTWIFPPGWK